MGVLKAGICLFCASWYEYVPLCVRICAVMCGGIVDAGFCGVARENPLGVGRL